MLLQPTASDPEELVATSMTAPPGSAESLVDLAWLVWLCIWIGWPIYEYARGKSKRVVRTGRGNALSGVLLIAAFLVFQIPFTGDLTFLSVGLVPAVALVVLLGIVLAVAGLAFSIWARLYLGTNWSGSAKLKQGQELVTSGPYSVVRNPIYLGLTIAMVGTGLVFGGYRVILAIVIILIFSWLRIRAEERLLSDQFGSEFARYKQSVKAFLPGLI
jgi:protein-S-isoprenylcysteine O-methyltransferase Ste14